jgi:hypothetical protein
MSTGGNTLTDARPVDREVTNHMAGGSKASRRDGKEAIAGRRHKRGLRRMVAAGIIAPAAIGAIVASSSPASAAGPTHLPSYGSSADFPTWVFGSTVLCVQNESSSYGTAKVQSRSGAAAEYMYIPAWRERCISRWWGGWPVTVTNVSNAYLIAYSY